MTIPDAIALCVLTVSWAAVMIAAMRYGGGRDRSSRAPRPSNHWFYETRPGRGARVDPQPPTTNTRPPQPGAATTEKEL